MNQASKLEAMSRQWDNGVAVGSLEIALADIKKWRDGMTKQFNENDQVFHIYFMGIDRAIKILEENILKAGAATD